MCSLIKPEVVIEWVGMDEDQRRSVSVDLVPNIDSGDSAVRRGFTRGSFPLPLKQISAVPAVLLYARLGCAE